MGKRDLSPARSMPLPKPICRVCRRAIQEKYMLVHYTNRHRDYMKKAQELGKEYSKLGYRKNRRRREIRGRLFPRAAG